MTVFSLKSNCMISDAPKNFLTLFFFKTGLKITVIKTDLYFQYVRLLTIKSSA